VWTAALSFKTSNPVCIVVRTSKELCRERLIAPAVVSPYMLSEIPINQKGREIFKMTKSVRLLLMGAALTGFVAGQTAFAQTAAGGDKDKPASTDTGKKATKTKKEKHACKGMNSCKGKGGCGSTKGKNDCKGKGECRTDGKPMDKEK
jgi:hypothetical protein